MSHESRPGPLVPVPMILALSVAAGGADALSILRLGNVFSSVMTGNLVLLGIGIGRRHGSLAVHALLAIAGFAVGVVAGSRLCPPGLTSRRAWARGAVRAIAVELVLGAALVAVWLAVSGRPTTTEASVMLAFATLAMGVQGGVVRVAPDKVPSTTYMTGSLTEVISEVAANRAVGTHARTLVALAGLVGGAVGTAVLVEYAAVVAPLLVLAALALSFAAAVGVVRALSPTGGAGRRPTGGG